MNILGWKKLKCIWKRNKLCKKDIILLAVNRDHYSIIISEMLFSTHLPPSVSQLHKCVLVLPWPEGLSSGCHVLSGFSIPSWKYKHLCQCVWWLCKLTQAGNHWTYLLWWLRFRSRSLWGRRWGTQLHVMTPFFISIYCITKANSTLSALSSSLTKKGNVPGLPRYRSASATPCDPGQNKHPLQGTVYFYFLSPWSPDGDSNPCLLPPPPPLSFLFLLQPSFKPDTSEPHWTSQWQNIFFNAISTPRQQKYFKHGQTSETIKQQYISFHLDQRDNF